MTIMNPLNSLYPAAFIEGTYEFNVNMDIDSNMTLISSIDKL